MGGCAIHGGDSSECSDDQRRNEELISNAGLAHLINNDDKNKMCDLWKCSAYCRKATMDMGCPDPDPTGIQTCERSKEKIDSCDVDCSGVGPGVVLPSFA